MNSFLSQGAIAEAQDRLERGEGVGVWVLSSVCVCQFCTCSLGPVC